ncbi:hypothetical protein AAFF_G00318040 [Aldrovandia affinis]|uniref:Uncharacterized protein n=1 Tax=Aldrovandia affinis TaxID=143900 RepID=A0AAD7R7C0_9TELE|nr:hypothetical protein AAFF_G00318040 [Aldrovandia affinis]
MRGDAKTAAAGETARGLQHQALQRSCAPRRNHPPLAETVGETENNPGTLKPAGPPRLAPRPPSGPKHSELLLDSDKSPPHPPSNPPTVPHCPERRRGAAPVRGVCRAHGGRHHLHSVVFHTRDRPQISHALLSAVEPDTRPEPRQAGRLTPEQQGTTAFPQHKPADRGHPTTLPFARIETTSLDFANHARLRSSFEFLSFD